MSELNVRIVELEPMRVASAHGFGESPEPQAWDKLLTWAESKGLLADRGAVRFFGFNNPSPSPGSPNYGYEQWMTVAPGVEAEGEIEIKTFPGGLYAVTRCEGLDDIGKKWKQLVLWGDNSPHKNRRHQCLEEFISPLDVMDQPDQYVFDLYLPIAE